MGQHDILVASSIAAERRTRTVRDADHRRLARERSTLAGTAVLDGRRRAGRLVGWLRGAAPSGALSR